VGAWVVLAWFWSASPAAAQTLEEARGAYLEARFEDAVPAFEAVLASAGLSAADAGEAHRYLVALHTMLGQVERAEPHAEAAVALNPEITAPEGAPPEAEELLSSARSELRGARAALEIEPTAPLVRGRSGELEATLVPARLAGIPELTLRCESGGAVAEERGPPPIVHVSLSMEGAEARCRATAVNAGGSPLVLASATLPAEEAMSGGDDVLVFSLIGGGAAVLVAGIIIVAVVLASGGGDQASLGAPRIVGW
jgi:hypothetical protein